MLRGADVDDIRELKRQGLSVSEIAAMCEYDRKTVRKYLREPGTPRYSPRPKRFSLLEPFRAYIDGRLTAGMWNAAELLKELWERGYAGRYTLLTDYLRPLRQAARTAAVRRFETPMGKQGQMDWGKLGDITFPDATKQSLSTFVLTLGSSRAMFADVTLDQKLPTLIRMHEAAFAYLGGVPEEILYDNQKTVIRQLLLEGAGVDERGEVKLNPVFSDFARYWGFVPRLCRPYRPQTKGKVESGVRYIRSSFLPGRTADDALDLSRQMLVWVDETANRRVHGTTHRLVGEAWEEEKPHLQPLGNRPAYAFVPEEKRRVPQDAFVTFRTNRYSVPWQLAGQEVSVRALGERLEIRREGAVLAEHALSLERFRWVTDSRHHEGMPFAPSHRGGKTYIHIEVAGPTVEVRGLEEYARAAGGMS